MQYVCYRKNNVCIVHRGSTNAASDIHRQLPTYMADIRRDRQTDQNTDWCFVVIGLVGRQSHSPLLQLKYTVSQKKGPTLKWYSSTLYGSILMIFGGNIQKSLE